MCQSDGYVAITSSKTIHINTHLKFTMGVYVVLHRLSSVNDWHSNHLWHKPLLPSPDVVIITPAPGSVKTVVLQDIVDFARADIVRTHRVNVFCDVKITLRINNPPAITT